MSGAETAAAAGVRSALASLRERRAKRWRELATVSNGEKDAGSPLDRFAAVVNRVKSEPVRATSSTKGNDKTSDATAATAAAATTKTADDDAAAETASASTDSDTGSRRGSKRRKDAQPAPPDGDVGVVEEGLNLDDLELTPRALLSVASHTERERHALTTRVLELIDSPTVMEQSISAKYSADESATHKFREFCTKFTAKHCMEATGESTPCEHLHFREIIRRCTDRSLGDCTFLTNCMRG
jgi:hypothetical protein